MSRYIDADALCEEFTRVVRRANNHDYEPTPNWNDAISIFHSMPTADVKPVVRGKWTDTTHGLMCSACETYQVYGSRFYNFCPICGAEMRGEEDGEVH